MTFEYPRACLTQTPSDHLEFTRYLVKNIEIMRKLIYEIEAGTPLGRVTAVIIHLLACKKTYWNQLSLNNVSPAEIAFLAEVSECQLAESLDYLEQCGFVLKK
jgi:hypothetical protein